MQSMTSFLNYEGKQLSNEQSKCSNKNEAFLLLSLPPPLFVSVTPRTPPLFTPSEEELQSCSEVIGIEEGDPWGTVPHTQAQTHRERPKMANKQSNSAL